LRDHSGEARFIHSDLVDVSALGRQRRDRHARVVKELRDSAEKVGFLYAANHGYPFVFVRRFAGSGEILFALLTTRR